MTAISFMSLVSLGHELDRLLAARADDEHLGLEVAAVEDEIEAAVLGRAAHGAGERGDAVLPLAGHLLARDRELGWRRRTSSTAATLQSRFCFISEPSPFGA